VTNADARGGDATGVPAAEIQKAELEAANGLRQFDLAMDMVRSFLEPERPFNLRPSHLQQLHKVALEGLISDPGQWRATPVAISRSAHKPPAPHLVGALVQEMCDYVNDCWHEKSAFFLSAYVMWRLNWIHPFEDGNGRTSRILSYIVLCLRLGYELPGAPVIPDQIQADRTSYFRALEAADAGPAADQPPELSVMEELIKGLLATQLLSVIEKGASP
jgi:Fic family protein